MCTRARACGREWGECACRDACTSMCCELRVACACRVRACRARRASCGCACGVHVYAHARVRRGVGMRAGVSGVSVRARTRVPATRACARVCVSWVVCDCGTRPTDRPTVRDFVRYRDPGSNGCVCIGPTPLGVHAWYRRLFPGSPRHPQRPRHGAAFRRARLSTTCRPVDFRVRQQAVIVPVVIRIRLHLRLALNAEMESAGYPSGHLGLPLYLFLLGLCSYKFR